MAVAYNSNMGCSFMFDKLYVELLADNFGEAFLAFYNNDRVDML